MTTTGFQWKLENLRNNRIVIISKPLMKIGRLKENDINCSSQHASRNHGVVIVDNNGKLHIRDNKSLNGTYLNSNTVPITPNVLTEIRENDLIGIGVTTNVVNIRTHQDDYVFKVIKERTERETEPEQNVEHKNNGKLSNEVAASVNNVQNKHSVSSNSCKVAVAENSRSIQIEPIASTSGIQSISSHDVNGIPDDYILEINKFSRDKDSDEEIPSAQSVIKEAGIKDSNSEVIEIIDSQDVPEIKQEVVETKICNFDPGIDYIVIDDDDDDDDIPASQMFSIAHEGPTNEQALEDLYNGIKKEVEEMDAFDNLRVFPPLSIDSDDESMNLESLLDTSIGDNNNTNVSSSAPALSDPVPSTSTVVVNETTVTRTSVPTKIFYTKPLPPPIIEPHNQKARRKSTDQKTRKRRNKPNEIDPSKKKPKVISPNTYRTDTKGLKAEFEKRHNKSPETPQKSQKTELNSIRKRRLKEIAEKQQNNMEAAKLKAAPVRVKQSDGRGNFLVEEQTRRVSKKKPSALSHPPNGIKKVKLKAECLPSSSRTPMKPIDAPVSSVFTETSNITLMHSSVFETAHEDVTISKTPPTPQLPSEVFQIFEWNPMWLKQQDTWAESPPIHKAKLVQLPLVFSSYDEYNRLMKPLLVEELWAGMHKEFKESLINKTNDRFPMAVKKVQIYPNFIELDCMTYVTKYHYYKRDYISVGDLLMVDLRVQSDAEADGKQICKPFFAYVHHLEKVIVLRDHHMIVEKVADQLPATPYAQVNCKLSIKKIKGNIITDKFTYCKIITSLVSTTRLFNSLKYLERSPLCRFILQPELILCRFPTTLSEPIVSMDNLNSTQLKCMIEVTNMCLGNNPSIYCLQGPPGTGKTTVITSLVQQMLFRKQKKDPCILITAPSNGAVDEIALRFIKLRSSLTDDYKKRLKLIRIGPHGAIHSDVKAYSLDEVAKRNLMLAALNDKSANVKYAQWKNDLVTLNEKLLNANEAHQEKLNKDIAFLKEKIETFPKYLYSFDHYRNEIEKMKDTLLCGSNIICSTLSGSLGKKMMDNYTKLKSRFLCCIVDEATQATELDLLMPLSLGIEKLVLVGDPQQLPATIYSKEAKKMGYGNSIFQRLTKITRNGWGSPIRMLDIQYRMHPEICHFPNKAFYNGQLVSSTTQDSILSPLVPYLVFNININTASGYQSIEEVQFVTSVLQAISQHVSTSRTKYTVGIITPYNGQKSAFNERLKTLNFSNLNVVCNTIDGFQGQEKDIIILSCVRNTPNAFVSDQQRINVAITRAKHILYVVGTSTLFKSCAVLGRMRQDAESRSLLLNINTVVDSQVILQAIQKPTY